MILDLILDREPHAVPAGKLVTAVERRELTGLLCATSVTTLDYLIARAAGREQARRAIATLLRLFEIAAVTRAVLEAALEVDFADFEDAVVHEAAAAVDVEGIVTRKRQDFRRASLPVFLPVELVAALAERG